jgi:hypothetical protein
MPRQSLFAGRPLDEFEQELPLYPRERIVERLGAKDFSPWPLAFIERAAAVHNLACLELFPGLGSFLEAAR